MILRRQLFKIHRVVGIGAGLSAGELVCIALAHQAEVLRQGDELGAGPGRLRDEGAGLGEVVVHPGGGNHLDGGGFHGWGAFGEYQSVVESRSFWVAATSPLLKTISMLNVDLTGVPLTSPGANLAALKAEIAAFASGSGMLISSTSTC